jgi:Predicted transcriptional regulators
MSYSLKQFSLSLGVPESTLRLYRDEFEEYLPVTGTGRRRRYPAEALGILRQIVVWKKEGWTGGQIREELRKSAQPAARARGRTAESRLDEAIALLRAQAGEIALLRAEVAALRADLRRADVPVAPTMEAIQREAIRAARRGE